METATQQVLKDNDEFRDWQASLLRRPKDVPYPILFHSSDDLNWCLLKRKDAITAQDAKDRIYVHFKGMEGEQVFEICCDRLQLPLFQQLLRDWDVYSSNKEKYSTSPFLLCSAALIWKERPHHRKQQAQQEIHPCDRYNLYLHCVVEHHALTEFGAEIVVAEKSAAVNRAIKRYEKKQAAAELTKEQQQNLSKLQTQLERLENPYPRSGKRLYKGKPNVVVGVAFSREEVVMAAVVDGATGKLITCQNTRQLLGKNYSLLSAYRLKQKHNAHQRHKDQVQGRGQRMVESEQGKYLDRLIAKAIVELARRHQAGSVAMPKLKGLRERLVSAIEASAMS